jgi:hypothetical protein
VLVCAVASTSTRIVARFVLGLVVHRLILVCRFVAQLLFVVGMQHTLTIPRAKLVKVEQCDAAVCLSEQLKVVGEDARRLSQGIEVCHFHACVIISLFWLDPVGAVDAFHSELFLVRCILPCLGRKEQRKSVGLRQQFVCPRLELALLGCIVACCRLCFDALDHDPCVRRIQHNLAIGPFRFLEFRVCV